MGNLQDKLHIVVIINHDNNLMGVMHDGVNIMNILNDTKYPNDVFFNLSTEQTLEKLKGIKTNAEYILFIYSGHGAYVPEANQGMIFCQGKGLLVSQLMTPFKNKEIHFIFNGCQVIEKPKLVPNEVGKFVLVYPALQGQEAETSKISGSFFINAFIKHVPKVISRYNQEVFLNWVTMAFASYKQCMSGRSDMEPRLCMPGFCNLRPEIKDGLDCHVDRCTNMKLSGEIVAKIKELEEKKRKAKQKEMAKKEIRVLRKELEEKKKKKNQRKEITELTMQLEERIVQKKVQFQEINDLIKKLV